MNKNQEVKALIRKFREGKISPEEKRRLFVLLLSGEADEGIFADMDLLFEGDGDELRSADEGSTARMRQRLIRELTMQEDGGMTRKGYPLKKLLLGIAAVVLMVAGTSFLFQVLFFSQQTVQISYTTKPGEHKELLLPDSSIVYLNGSTTISFPAKFDGYQRLVQLDGEAYFKVHKSPDRPFLLTGSTFAIRVLGTSFNVNTDLRPSVAVTEGKVQVLKQDPSQVTTNLLRNWKEQASRCASFVLEAREKAILPAGQNKWTKAEYSDETDWRNGKFSFYKEKLSVVVRELSRYHGISIELDPRIAGLEINLSTGSQPLAETVKTLALVANGTCAFRSGRWILEKKR